MWKINICRNLLRYDQSKEYYVSYYLINLIIREREMANLKQVFTILILLLSVSVLSFGSIEKNVKKTFDVKTGGQLFVDTDKGSISIQTHTSSKIDVEVFFKAKTEMKKRLKNYLVISKLIMTITVLI